MLIYLKSIKIYIHISNKNHFINENQFYLVLNPDIVL
jgi:hypothetical protein